MSTKPKTIRARRMWASNDPSYPESVRFQVYNNKSEIPPLEPIPVAVLDVSDEAALIEQVARAIAAAHGNDWSNYPVMECYGKPARAVLSSLNLIPAKRRARK